MRVTWVCVAILGGAMSACGQDSSSGTQSCDGGFLACLAAGAAAGSGGFGNGGLGNGGLGGGGALGNGGFAAGGTGGATSSGGAAGSGGINSGIGGSPVTGNCTVSLLNYAVVDAEYDVSLDRIVVVSENPNLLHVVDGATKAETAVALPRAPVAVSVAPDGATAAVAHDGFVSWIDLRALQVKKTVTLLSDAHDVLLDGSGNAYVFPATNQWVNVHSVDLNAGTDKTPAGTTANVYAGSVGVLVPSLGAIYAAEPLDPSLTERYDIAKGVATDSLWSGDPACVGLWPSAQGDRFYTACGTALRASNTQSEDMKQIGQFFQAFYGSIQHLTERGSSVFMIRSNGQGPTALDDTKVEIYSAGDFSLQSERDVPCISTPSRNVRAHGRFVFPAAAGTPVVVLVQADAGSAVAGNWGIATL